MISTHNLISSTYRLKMTKLFPDVLWKPCSFHDWLKTLAWLRRSSVHCITREIRGNCVLHLHLNQPVLSGILVWPQREPAGRCVVSTHAHDWHQTQCRERGEEAVNDDQCQTKLTISQILVGHVSQQAPRLAMPLYYSYIIKLIKEGSRHGSYRKCYPFFHRILTVRAGRHHETLRISTSVSEDLNIELQRSCGPFIWKN